jgi:N-acetylmuramoyl-L-alanine amidase
MIKFKKKYLVFLICFLWVLIGGKNNVLAVNLDRIGGQNRYDTAVKISQQYWGNSDYAVIASGCDYPDALCAAPLAKKYNAPILLTEGDRITTVTLNELKRLNVKKIFIIGGTGSISKKAEYELEKLADTCTRIGGQTRYDTSVEVAKYLGSIDKVVLVSGENFPDSISIGSIAAYKSMPILLTQKNYLPNSIKDYINGKNINTTYVIGGKGVISDSILSNFNNIKRLSGEDRYSTNIAVIKEFMKELNLNTVYIASGENFPDALSGSAAAAAKTSSIVLVNNSIPKVTKEFVLSIKNSMSCLEILGGTGVIPYITAVNLLKEDTSGTIGNSGKIICIDAGHGGPDSGAVGPTGIMEKDVALAVTLKVGNILKNKGIGVVYTRTNDNAPWSNGTSADLQHRCDVAKGASADYFVSIHCNSAESSYANGTETFSFYSSEKGKKLAKCIQEELVSKLGTYDRGIKTAGFYVLKNTSCPAILTELGFISNPNEEKLLNSDSYQNKCAEAISNGIIKFLKNN